VRALKQTSNELADKQAELKFALLSERQQSEKLAEQIVQVHAAVGSMAKEIDYGEDSNYVRLLSVVVVVVCSPPKSCKSRWRRWSRRLSGSEAAPRRPKNTGESYKAGSMALRGYALATAILLGSRPKPRAGA
jgi:hypothetical protein